MSQKLVAAIDSMFALRRAAQGLQVTIPPTAASKVTAGAGLLISCLDLGKAMAAIVRDDPNGGWLAAHVLQRPQMEHFLRGAFFLGLASEEEARRFIEKDKLPVRSEGRKKGATTISLSEMADEVDRKWGWGDKLKHAVDGTKRDLHGAVHGGAQVVRIYCSKGEIGDPSVPAKDLVGMFCNPLVFSAQALLLLSRDENVTVEDRRSLNEVLQRAREATRQAGESLDQGAN